jgi:general secretion pathway protein I
MKRRGFTLVEVLVALFVIALGVGALLTTLMSSANAAQYLRDKSMAQWIALNRVSETRLSGSRPTVGVTSDTVEFANAMWRWRQQVSDAGISGLMRIDVQVARVGELDSAGAQLDVGEQAEEELPMLGRAIGFVGTALARPNGLTPEWSPRPPAPPGEGGPGGGGGGGGGGGPDGGADGDPP